MESASIPVRPTRSRAEVAREYVSKFGLIVVLAALPVYFGFKDLADEGVDGAQGHEVLELLDAEDEVAHHQPEQDDREWP